MRCRVAAIASVPLRTRPARASSAYAPSKSPPAASACALHQHRGFDRGDAALRARLQRPQRLRPAEQVQRAARDVQIARTAARVHRPGTGRKPGRRDPPHPDRFSPPAARATACAARCRGAGHSAARPGHRRHPAPSTPAPAAPRGPFPAAACPGRCPAPACAGRAAAGSRIPRFRTDHPGPAPAARWRGRAPAGRCGPLATSSSARRPARRRRGC